MCLTLDDIQICEEAQRIWREDLRRIFDAKSSFPQNVSVDDLDRAVLRNPFTNRRHQYLLFKKDTAELVDLYLRFEGYRHSVGTGERWMTNNGFGN